MGQWKVPQGGNLREPRKELEVPLKILHCLSCVYLPVRGYLMLQKIFLNGITADGLEILGEIVQLARVVT